MREITMTRLPTLFLSHGSPMHAIEPGAAGAAWASLGKTLPRPRAVLMASAHWETSLAMVTGNPRPATIHDFGGFPSELYKLAYPAPGAPEIATRAVALLKAAGITAGVDGCRGLDHGAWVPLRWMYPDADVPVIQLSLQTELGAAHHLRLGRALAPLADEGVLIVGSGHTTHNLRDWMGNPRRQEPLPYAQAFAAGSAGNSPRTTGLAGRVRLAPEAAAHRLERTSSRCSSPGALAGTARHPVRRRIRDRRPVDGFAFG
jgi:4,5-DOPA dioxygenase extradiol